MGNLQGVNERGTRFTRAHRSAIYTCRVHWFLLVVAVLYLGRSASVAQTWTSLGGPGGISPNDILFTKSGQLICSTFQGVFVSGDSGSSWQRKLPDPSLGTIYSMTERASGSIIAIAARGIVESTDAGSSWTMLEATYGLFNYATAIIESPVDTSLYFRTDQALFKSTTGGTSWLQITEGSTLDSYAVDDSGWIYLGVRDVGVLQSTDKGASFHPYPIGYDLTYKQVISILTNHSGGLYVKLFGIPDPILHFENGQVTEIADGWTNPLLGVTPEGDLIYKAGNSIALYNHVTRQSVAGSANSFIKDQFAQKAVVHGNTWVTSFTSRGLHRSTDRGRSWIDINRGLGVQQCLCVCAPEDNRLLVGTFGYAFWGGLYETQDTGKTWTNLNPLEYDAYFIDISRMANGGIVAGGSYGEFYCNADGNPWIHPDSITMAYAQFVSSTGTIFVGDIYNGVYVSTTNGWKWSTANNGLTQEAILAFGEGSSGRVFAAGGSGGVYCTDNNGGSWTPVDQSVMGYVDVFDFKLKGKNLIAGTASGMFVSHDNGDTWSYMPGLNGSVRKIIVLPTGDVVASVQNRGVFSSSNDGLQWEQINSGLTDSTVWGFATDRYGRLFAASSSGVFETDRYFNALTAAVHSCFLDYNFPNPFNGTTTIHYALPQRVSVDLSIFNIVGQKITTLVRDVEDAGNHYAIFNGTGLASGVYFCRMNAGGSVLTRKILLLK